MISYHDFDLRIVADGDRFAVTAKLGEQTASEPLDLDLSLDWDLGKLERAGRDEIDRRGVLLFNALIRDRVRDLYQQARGRTGKDPTKGMRIRIVIDPRQPRLTPFVRLPWEILRDPFADAGWLPALDARRPVVRMLDSIEPCVTPPRERVQRVLLALASPAGEVPLDVERECDAVVTALRQHGIQPQVLRHATQKSFCEQIAAFSPQVVHFMGHGDHDARRGEGVLLLEDDEGRCDLLAASTLATFFAGRAAPKLVILTSCLTAVPGREKTFGPFSSIAASLVATGLPAVIAMQSEIRDHNALHFTERLYDGVLRKEPIPIEAAVSEARVALRASSRYTLDWASPVLFLRTDEQRVFADASPSSDSPQPQIQAPAQTTYQAYDQSIQIIGNVKQVNDYRGSK